MFINGILNTLRLEISAWNEQFVRTLDDKK